MIKLSIYSQCTYPTKSSIPSQKQTRPTVMFQSHNFQAVEKLLSALVLIKPILLGINIKGKPGKVKC